MKAKHLITISLVLTFLSLKAQPFQESFEYFNHNFNSKNIFHFFTTMYCMVLVFLHIFVM